MKRLIALGTALTVVSLSHAGTYLRPQIAYIMPEDSGSDSTVGVFTAFGFTPGTAAEHDFEIEVGWAKWDFAETGVVEGFDFTGTADVRIIPVLANYRFSAELGKNVRGYLQAGVGVTRVSLDWAVEIEDEFSAEGSDSSTEFSYDLGAGVTWQASANMAFNLGYRYLNIASMDVEVEGETADLGDLGAHIVEAGLTFRF